jgi:hypothetical protein
MIAAGVNPEALQTFMGHASITMTLDGETVGKFRPCPTGLQRRCE